jgi:nucleoside-diphosphate-sugar epimerase
MNIAVTGATGFLGRYIVNHLLENGHACRCWHRPDSDRGGFVDASGRLTWLPGELNDPAATDALVDGVDAVVHAALDRPGAGFRGAEGDLTRFAETNVLGSLRLMQQARHAGVKRFVFISTCAVHEVILDDRPLDEAHPLWATSHYGAHKAAIEKFVHSFGLGEGWDICALRPTGIYGLARPAPNSKWYQLVQHVKAGKPIDTPRGGKEVHAADVAKAVGILLTADGVAGQAYNCYDMYIADQDVAAIAKTLTGSDSPIADRNKGPKNQIDTHKLRALGMTFGARNLLESTVQSILNA